MTKLFPIKDAGDGKGTARALLDKIADMESEAQKSFMHRLVFSQGLTNCFFFFPPSVYLEILFFHILILQSSKYI